MFVFWEGILMLQENVKEIGSDISEEVRVDRMDKWRSWSESNKGSSIIERKVKYVGTDSGGMIDLMIGFSEILYKLGLLSQ